MTEESANPEDRNLRDSERASSLFNLPVALSHRLNKLVDLTAESGVRVHRVDVVAALILAAPESADELLKLHLEYGKAHVKDAAIEGEPVSNVLHLDRAKPGRRPRARGN